MPKITLKSLDVLTNHHTNIPTKYLLNITALALAKRLF